MLFTTRPNPPDSARHSPGSPLDQLTAPAKQPLRRASIIAVLANLLWIVQAAAVAVAMSSLFKDTGMTISPWLAITLFAFTGILRSALDNHSARLCFSAADQIIHNVRNDLLRSEALRSPMDAEQPASALVASLAAEKTASLQPYLMRYAPARARVLAVPIAILLVALPISWVVTLILLAAGPLIPLFMALIGMAAKDASEQHMREVGSLNALLLERLSALVDIRLLHAEELTVERFRDSADNLRIRTMAVLRIAFLSSTVLELFAAIGVAMVAVYVGFVLLGELSFGSWGTSLSLGQGIFLLMLAPEFFQPLRDLAAAWHEKAAANAVADELSALTRNKHTDILGEGDNVVPSRVAAHSIDTPALISTKALGLKTASGQQLSFPDIKVYAGDSIAICGPSGAGKSTLLSLLGGLVAPGSGEITVSGKLLDSSSADAWRSRIGWMSQAPWFIAGTVQENLALGGDVHDAPALQEALRLASANAVIDTLPVGLNTRLGESGSGVSGGEARRLTLARLVLADRELILADEPTSDLDDRTATAVSNTLLMLVKRGATLIVATHDEKLTARMQQSITLSSLA